MMMMMKNNDNYAPTPPYLGFGCDLGAKMVQK